MKRIAKTLPVFFFMLCAGRLWAVEAIGMTGWTGLGELNVLPALGSLTMSIAPAIAGINPSSVAAEHSGFTLTVNGSNLQNGCVVSWDGQALPTTFVNAGQVTASVDASWVVSPGTASIQVINPDAGVSNSMAFAIVSAPQNPVLASPDFTAMRVYPNPFRSARGDRHITFDQLPVNSVVKIFTLSSRQIRTLQAPGGSVDWDLANNAGEQAASGIYLFLIMDGQGRKTHGTFSVIR